MKDAVKKFVDEVVKVIVESNELEFAEKEETLLGKMEQECRMLQFERKFWATKGWYKGDAYEAWESIQAGRKYREEKGIA